MGEPDISLNLSPKSLEVGLPDTVFIDFKHGRDLIQRDIDEYAQFLKNERRSVTDFGPHNNLRVDSALNNAFAIQYLQEAKNTYPESVVMIVRKKHDRSIIGSCITLIENQNGTKSGQSSIIGFGWAYQRKGLGTLVLARHINALKAEGVKVFTVNVWEASKRLLDKLHLRYVADPDSSTSLTISLT